jgi:hypothetical protein
MASTRFLPLADITQDTGITGTRSRLEVKKSGAEAAKEEKEPQRTGCGGRAAASLRQEGKIGVTALANKKEITAFNKAGVFDDKSQTESIEYQAYLY